MIRSRPNDSSSLHDEPGPHEANASSSLRSELSPHETHDFSSLSSEPCPSHDCSICLSSDDTEWYLLSQCQHKFHSNCLKQWVTSGKNTCPFCRRKLCKRDKTAIGCGPSGYRFRIFGDLLSGEPLWVTEAISSDTESDLPSDSDMESVAESENEDVSVLELLPNTMGQLITEMLESVNRF